MAAQVKEQGWMDTDAGAEVEEKEQDGIQVYGWLDKGSDQFQMKPCVLERVLAGECAVAAAPSPLRREGLRAGAEPEPEPDGLETLYCSEPLLSKQQVWVCV